MWRNRWHFESQPLCYKPAGQGASGQGWAALVHFAGLYGQHAADREGAPKAILLSGSALADVEDRLIGAMGVPYEIREYTGVPVTYSFGLAQALAVARVGSALYLPKVFDPLEIRDMLAADGVNAISAVSSLWHVVLPNSGFPGDLGAKVRWIEIGT